MSHNNLVKLLMMLLKENLEKILFDNGKFE